MSLKYGVWYAWKDQAAHNAWSHIKVDQVDEHLPTTYHHASRSRGRSRRPEDAGFFATMVDSRDLHLSYYAPPMVDPPTWRPGQTPNRTGEDYIKWLSEFVAKGELVESPEPATRPR